MKRGFNLRKWRTSDKTLQEIIDDKEIAKTGQASKIESDELSHTQTTVGEPSQLRPNECKALGIKLNCSDDNLILTFERLVLMSKELPQTERHILKVAASLFDPIGFISPVTIRMKILLQEACLLK